MIQEGGPVDEAEMRRTFNLGVGYIFIVPEREQTRTLEVLRRVGEQPFFLGSIESVGSSVPFEERVRFLG